MRLKLAGTVSALLGMAAACAAPGVVITGVPVDETPADVRALAEGAAAGFVIGEVQKKVREGRTYYDVEGQLPDGSELEFDILMTEAGPEIVETQRDLAWADVPAEVQAAAEASAPGLVPARVIESTQADGLVIYELFAPGEPADPSMELSLGDDGAKVLDARWPH